MTKRFLAAALALTSVAGPIGAAPAAATPQPTPITIPGGRLPNRVHADVAGCDSDGVCIVKDDTSGATCQTDRQPSDITPPAEIRVLITATNQIETVPFETYVEDVLPVEWVPSWDGDSLKAGAVSVKSYAWYWVNHFGGDLNGNTTNCFDVTDSPSSFQRYKPGSGSSAGAARSTRAVQETWPVVARKGGHIFQAQYLSYFHSSAEACGSYLYADRSQLSQWGTQNCNEASTAYKYNVILQLYYGTNLQLATTSQLRSQHDFQYLHHSTPATFSNGTWTIADGYPTTIRFGAKGDVPVVNTVGDGFARVGVFRPSTNVWYLGTPTGGIMSSFRFGDKGDIPAAAQYGGLASPTQVAIYRPSTGTWWFATSRGAVASTVRYGNPGDIPVPGRWSSTTTDSIAVYRPSTGTWYVRGRAGVRWGAKGDVPTPADYNGDGITDFATYRPSTHEFYVRGQAGVTWGLKGDVPVTGDFNGDGADLAVYRPSKHTLYVRGIETVVLPAGTPIGKAPYAD